MACTQVVETPVANNNLLRTLVTQMINFNQGMLLPGSNHFLIEKCFEQTMSSEGVICSISRVRVRDWLCMEPSNCGHQCWRLCSGKLHYIEK